MRARGLKLHLIHDAAQVAHVAPHAGAWIETSPPARRASPRRSRPMRARGLKHAILDCFNEKSVVAPHAGAWIETAGHARSTSGMPSRPIAGAWIETSAAISLSSDPNRCWTMIRPGSSALGFRNL